MWAIFIMGIAFIAILAGAFSYTITLIELVIISGLSFLVFKFIIDKKRVLFWLSLTGSLGIIIAIYYLYRKAMLISIVKKIVQFILPYYYSVYIEGYYIGRLHQLIILSILGTIIYYVFNQLHHYQKTRLIPPMLGIVTIVIAFFLGTFSGKQDQQTFVLYIGAASIYLYDHFLLRMVANPSQTIKISFYRLGFVMAICVILLGTIGHGAFENPFQIKVRREGSFNPQYDVDTQERIEQEQLQYQVSDSYELQSSFLHQGIELFRVKTDYLKYFKTQTYDTFVEDRWTNQQQDAIVEEDWPLEPILREALPLDQNAFHAENIEIRYMNIQTDSILSAPFVRDMLFPDATINVHVDQSSAIISETLLGKDVNYTMEVVIPKYGTTAFTQLLQNQEEIKWRQMDIYVNLPEGSEKILELSNEITQGLSSQLDKAKAIETYLQENYEYNINPEYNKQEKMVEQFLFEKKEGFCQQYATSMVLLLRAQGIPSRFVTGYVLPEVESDYESIPEEIMYREDMERDPYQHIYDVNAHAWVEVYYPNIGWIQYEPTSGLSNYQFFDPIITMTEQADTLEENQTISQQQREITLYVLVCALCILILLMIILMARRYKRHHQDPKKRFIRTYKLLMMYLKALKLGKEESQTIREFSGYLENRLINGQLKFRNYVAILENAFYNQGMPSDEDLESFEIFFVDVKKTAKRTLDRFTYRRLRILEMFAIYRGRI